MLRIGSNSLLDTRRDPGLTPSNVLLDLTLSLLRRCLCCWPLSRHETARRFLGPTTSSRIIARCSSYRAAANGHEVHAGWLALARRNQLEAVLHRVSEQKVCYCDIPSRRHTACDCQISDRPALDPPREGPWSRLALFSVPLGTLTWSNILERGPIGSR